MTLTFDQYLPETTSYTITAAPITFWRINPQFSGTGQLRTAITNITPKFAGTGTLSAQITGLHPQFNGLGTLMAAAFIGQAGIPADFIGRGQLTATASGS
jgi:hypothetical protein